MAFIPGLAGAQTTEQLDSLVNLEIQISQSGNLDSQAVFMLIKADIWEKAGRKDNAVLSLSRIKVRSVSESMQCHFQRRILTLMLAEKNYSKALAWSNSTKDICQTDSMVRILRAITLLETEHTQRFKDELALIGADSTAFAAFNSLAYLNAVPEDEKTCFPPAWYFRHHQPWVALKLTTVLLTPLALTTLCVIAGIPVTGIILGSYFEYRFYTGALHTIEEDPSQKRENADLQQKIAGYRLIRKLQIR